MNHPQAILRKYIKHVLLVEASQLPAEYFSKIDDALTNSSFWSKSNYYDDIDEGPRGSLQTPAATALELALQAVIDEVGLDMDVYVSSHASGDLNTILTPDHPAYPDRWLIDARWYVSKIKPGRNTIDLEIMAYDDAVDSQDVNPQALVRHIAQTVRHELVHYTQMKKQSLNKGLYNDIEAFQDMLKDPKQVPNEDDPKYWDIYEPTGKIDPKTKEEIIEKKGFDQKLYTQDYLKSHIEIDAHAHDAAEDLIAVYGEQGAIAQLRGGFSLEDPKLPNAISHYYTYLDPHDPIITKLKSKIYSYIKYFGEL